MKNNLTIIIPTHERQTLLIRSIKYYEKLNYNIIIVDSSDTKLIYSFKKNFLYFNYPNCGFNLKIYKILNYIKTDFVTFSPDDDYLVNDFLIHSINILSKNQKISSVRGTSVKFKYEYEKLFFKNYKKNKIIFKTRNYDSIYKNFQNLLYAVNRKKILVDAAHISKDYNYITIFEWILPFIALKKGEVHIIENINILRDANRYTNYFEQDNKYYFKNSINLNKKIKVIKTNYIITDWHSFFNSSDGKDLKQTISHYFSDKKIINEIDNIINNFVFKKNSPNLFNIVFINFKKIIKKIINPMILKIYLKKRKNKFDIENLDIDLKNINDSLSTIPSKL